MIALTNWSVAGWSDHRLTLVLGYEIKVRVEVQYEDWESAMYDREDNCWVGAEVASTDVEEEVEIEELSGASSAGLMTNAHGDARQRTTDRPALCVR